MEDQLQNIIRLKSPPQDIIGGEWMKWSKKVEEYGRLLNKPSTRELLQLLDIQVAPGKSVLSLRDHIMYVGNPYIHSYVPVFIQLCRYITVGEPFF